MSATTVLPPTLHLRPGRLVALIVAVVALTAALTWAVAVSVIDSTEERRATSSGTATAIDHTQLGRAYVEGLRTLTPDELGWAYGVDSSSFDRGRYDRAQATLAAGAAFTPMSPLQAEAALAAGLADSAVGLLSGR